MRTERLANGKNRVHHKQSVQFGTEARVHGQGETQRPSPILNYQTDIAKSEMLNETQKEISMKVKAVGRVLHGLVGTSESEKVGPARSPSRPRWSRRYSLLPLRRCRRCTPQPRPAHRPRLRQLRTRSAAASAHARRYFAARSCNRSGTTSQNSTETSIIERHEIPSSTEGASSPLLTSLR